VAKVFLLLLVLLTVGVACGLTGRDPTPRPTRTPRPTLRPTFTAAAPTPTPTLRPILPSFLGGRTATPVTRSVQAGNDARNLVWAYLSRCVSFDPQDLVSYQVQNDWYVKAQLDSSQQFGIWKIDSFSGRLNPHDPLADEWQKFLDSNCNSATSSILVLPTQTPRLVLPAPVLQTSSDAINTVWAYLVKCFPDLKTTDFEAAYDAPAGEYLVKDKGSANFYGVWRVDKTYGKITPDNDRASTRDFVVKTASC